MQFRQRQMEEESSFHVTYMFQMNSKLIKMWLEAFKLCMGSNPYPHYALQHCTTLKICNKCENFP